MYAYWYEYGQLKTYEGTWEYFKERKDSYSYYIYGEFQYMSIDWFKSEIVYGCRHVFNIFPEDVPSEIRAMHLLLVKE